MEKSIHPLPGVLPAVSGASDDLAPSATGKLLCALLTGTLRDLPDRLQLMLPLLLTFPSNAKVYTERGGTGHEYYTVKFRVMDLKTGRTRQQSCYLGRLEPDQLAWVRGILEERAARNRSSNPKIQVDKERIQQLLALRKQAHSCARIVAKEAGYTWRGYRLLKRSTQHDVHHSR